MRELPPCARKGCGHRPDRHSLAEEQNLGPLDPGAKFRCNVGLMTTDGASPCGCPDYLEY